MQLTKDDVKTEKVVCDLCDGNGIEYFDSPSSYRDHMCQNCRGTGKIEKISLDFSKFLEVREFYEKYESDDIYLEDEHPEIYQLWKQSKEFVNHGSNPIRHGYDYNHWLFHYCFKDGLK